MRNEQAHQETWRVYFFKRVQGCRVWGIKINFSALLHFIFHRLLSGPLSGRSAKAVIEILISAGPAISQNCSGRHSLGFNGGAKYCSDSRVWLLLFFIDCYGSLVPGRSVCTGLQVQGVFEARPGVH